MGRIRFEPLVESCSTPHNGQRYKYIYIHDSTQKSVKLIQAFIVLRLHYVTTYGRSGYGVGSLDISHPVSEMSRIRLG